MPQIFINLMLCSPTQPNPTFFPFLLKFTAQVGLQGITILTFDRKSDFAIKHQIDESLGHLGEDFHAIKSIKLIKV